MQKYLIPLALLSFSVGCNLKVEPTSNTNIAVSQERAGNSISSNSNNSDSLAKPVKVTKGEHVNADFKSHYIELGKLTCQPVDADQTGVRMVQDKCPAYSVEGQDYWVRREWFEESRQNTSESGRIWTVELLGEENRIPMIPKTACPAFGDKMTGISFGKKMEFLLWRGKPFASILRIKCHVEPENWDGGMDPERVSEEEWKVTKEMLVVRGIDLNDQIEAFDIDTKNTPNANEATRRRAENAYLEMVEKGR